MGETFNYNVYVLCVEREKGEEKQAIVEGTPKNISNLILKNQQQQQQPWAQLYE